MNKIVIFCNGKMIADSIRIPESMWEQFIGLRGQKIKKGQAMLYKYDQEMFCMFDMIGVPEKLGYIALNKDKRIVSIGIMKAWIGSWIGKCQYFIEVHHGIIQGLKKGDIVNL